MTKRNKLIFTLSLLFLMLLFSGCGSKKEEAKEWYEKGLNTQNPNLAVEHFAKAIELYPDYAEANYQLAHMSISGGANYAEDLAIPYLLKAIELNPKYYEAYFDLGKALEHYWSSKMYDKEEFLRKELNYEGEFSSEGLAHACFYKVLELKPNHIPSYYELAYMYSSLFYNGFITKEEYILALECYEKILKIDSNQAKAYYNSADIYLRVTYNRAMGTDNKEGWKNSYEKALSLLRKQIRIDHGTNSSLDAYNKIISIFEALGNREKVEYFTDRRNKIFYNY